MQSEVTAELVERLARVAGFDFALERCVLLAPQLEWLLGEAAQIRQLPMAQEEPMNVFRPLWRETEPAGQEGEDA